MFDYSSKSALLLSCEKIYYEVRFEGYRYNTGCRDNGIRVCIKSLENMDGVNKFIEFIKKMILFSTYREEYISEEDRSMLYDTYGIDYVTEFVGVFKITEEEIPINKFGAFI